MRTDRRTACSSEDIHTNFSGTRRGDYERNVAAHGAAASTPGDAAVRNGRFAG